MNSQLTDEPVKVTEVLVESVVALSPPETQTIIDMFTSKLGPISLKLELNPLLLGGLRITYLGKVIDLSFNTKLDSIHEKMLVYAPK